MPFNFPFKIPFPFGRYVYPQQKMHHIVPDKQISSDLKTYSHKSVSHEKKDSEAKECSESFFEIFGIKLYFDDILIICILFFLYSEKVKDDELFICLILLLIT